MPTKSKKSALDILSPLLDDPDVIEIMIDGPQRVTVQKFGDKIEDADVRFKSNDEVLDVIKSVLAGVGVTFEEDKAIYDVRLSDNSRMMAILSPAAINGHSIIFRKFMTRQITWEKLLEYNSVNNETRGLIQSAIDAHISMLVAGGTASGKTTFTNRIVELIPSEERVVAVEQTHEFQFDHPRAIFLEADESMRAKMNDLLTAGSKMRPDWLVVGEMNGAEAMRTMQIFANGHTGITTIHANGIENALTRLEAMCLMANLGLGLDDIREMIASALGLLLYQECLVPNGRRKVTQISELRGLENGHYVLQPLMRYNAGRDTFEMTGAKPSWQK